MTTYFETLKGQFTLAKLADSIAPIDRYFVPLLGTREHRLYEIKNNNKIVNAVSLWVGTNQFDEKSKIEAERKPKRAAAELILGHIACVTANKRLGRQYTAEQSSQLDDARYFISKITDLSLALELSDIIDDIDHKQKPLFREAQNV